ncbi:MAG: SDR family NAD(P)-dependent oxidoreductase [bacterium]|nr:SDR family NAD(P)-dependent oxidoreductase [bacterium]MCP5067730.1 SDR family NAD(P)-dependent oxidoreductase [bacterium]
MQVVVISGLAQGMGREVAIRLAREGVAIAGFDLDAEGIESLRKEITGFGGNPVLARIDVCDRARILEFKDEVLDTFGHVDVVVSNVGIGFFGPFEEVDLERASRCFETNVLGTAALLQAFIPSMRERRSGKLVAVSSLVGQIPFPFESIYSASKFAMEGLVLSLRYEVEPFGIQVALIQPAQVSTGFAAKVHVLPAEGSPYRDRVRRFIERDEQLIKTAPDPATAALKIISVIQSPSPKLHNAIDTKSRLFLALNRFLPARWRDSLLLGQMDIR